MIEKGYYSNLYRHRNTTILWEGTDSLEQFNTNRIKSPSDETLLYYIKNPIEYNFNKYGYRAINKDDKADKILNLYLGCSHTFGTGHHIENTWSYMLHKEIGGGYLNLGQPGTGLLTGYRLLKYWLPKISVRNVFIFYPHAARYEYYLPKSDKYQTITSHFPDLTGTVTDALNHNFNMELYKELVSNSIRQICQEFSTPLYMLTEFPGFLGNLKNTSLKARDLIHIDSIHQSSIKNNFLKLIN